MCCNRAHLKDIVSIQDRADSLLPHSRSSFSLLSHETEPCDRIWHTTESTSRLLRTSPTKVRVLAEHSKQVSMSLHLLIVGTTVCMRPNSIMAMLSRQVSHHNLAECHPAPLYTPCSALHCMSTWSTTGVALACRQGAAEQKPGDGSQRDGFCLSGVSGSRARLPPAAGSVPAA